MLKDVRVIPVTETSEPFAAAEKICHFKEIGYVEEEYFLTGEANIYQEGENHSAKILYYNAPYTTRILVRRPVLPKKFSGNVVLEILNSSAGFDIDRMWVNSWPFFTRNGDVYVGITSKGNVVDSLIQWDQKRYSLINWKNPHPERKIPENIPTNGPFSFLPQYEMGLFWDMLIDCATLLKSKNEQNPLKGFPDRHLYLTGWSQSGFYIARYLATFHDPNNSLFEGFLSAGSTAGLMPLNSYEKTGSIFGTPGIPAGNMMGTRQPTIAVNTESENRVANWVGDFDEPGFKFRTYQIAASSHDSKHSIVDYYNRNGCNPLRRIGRGNGFTPADGDLLDYPYHFIFNAAFHHLYCWAREGIPAPHAPKIETRVAFKESTDAFGSYLENCIDAFGNCKGGIRTPAVDYPTGKYTSFSTDDQGKVNATFGKVNPFSPDLLKNLYGTLENYRKLVEKGADDMLAKGFLLPEDREEMIRVIMETASQRGLL